MGSIMYGGDRFQASEYVIPNPNETPTANLDTLAIGPEVYNVPGVSGQGFFDEFHQLCYGESGVIYSDTYPNRVDLETLYTYNDYSDYLSYSHTAGEREFTVLQDFTALILSWVHQDRAQSNSQKACGGFYLLSLPVLHYTVENGSAIDVTEGACYLYHFTAGQKFRVDCASILSSHLVGYHQQMIKVFFTTSETLARLAVQLIQEDWNQCELQYLSQGGS